MNKLLTDLEKSIAKYQDELWQDAESFRASLEAFRKTKAKRNSDRYLELYGQLYADIAQLKNSAETVQEFMDQADNLEALLEEEKAA